MKEVVTVFEGVMLAEEELQLQRWRSILKQWNNDTKVSIGEGLRRASDFLKYIKREGKITDF